MVRSPSPAMRLAAVLLAWAFAVSVMAGPAEGRVTVELIDTLGRSHAVQVELAVDEQARARGLMFRRQLAPEEGMLFVFPTSAPVRMWMRNTLLPLDMLFFDEAGVLVEVAPNCEPLSERLIGPPVPVRAVLELPAGAAERLSLLPGARMVAPDLRSLSTQ